MHNLINCRAYLDKIKEQMRSKKKEFLKGFETIIESWSLKINTNYALPRKAKD